MHSTHSSHQDTHAAPIAAWKWRVLALVAAAIFIVVLDFSVVNVALPSIEKQLAFTPTSLQWVASAYAIMFGGFLLLGGRCADLLGRRRVLLTGVGIFSFASLIAGLSGFIHVYGRETLIACRALQGLGGALIGPAALSIVNTTFDEGHERHRAMGVFGSIATAGFACGNLLGGILTGHFGWPSIFFVNVPLGLLLLTLAPKLVPASAGGNLKERLNWNTLDVGGAFTVTASLIALIYAFIGAERLGWTSVTTLFTFALSAVLLVIFVSIEKRLENPLVPLSIFARRTLTSANIVMLLIEAINAASILFLSLYLQQVKGYSPQKTGFAFLPLALWMIVASNLAPRFVGRYGARPILIGGTILTTLGPLLLSRLTTDSIYLRDILPVLLMTGTGIAAAITAGFITATSGLPDEEQGLASGLIQTSQQVGAALGLAILVSVSASFSAKATLAGASPAVSQVAGLHAAFLVGTLFSALGCLTAILSVKPDQQPGAVQTEESADDFEDDPSAADLYEPVSS